MASACRAGAPRGLGGMGTPRAARCSAGSRPARTTPGPGGPGRRTRSRRATSASGRRPSTRPGRLEPRHPLVLLRRQPGLLPHQRAQPPAAVADLLGDRRAPARRGSARPAPGPPRPAASAAPLRASARVSARATTARPSSRLDAGQPLGQVGQVGSDVLQLEQLPRQLGGRYAEQRPRARRGQPELDARAGCRRGGSPPARRAAPTPSTTAAARAVPSRPADVERLPHRQHEGQARRRQPPVHPGRAQVDVVGHQRGDVRRQDRGTAAIRR